MGNDITKHIRPLRLGALPEDMRLALKDAREKRGWTQRDLASRLGLTQTHISGIESGKIVPRYDTLLELVRILDTTSSWSRAPSSPSCSRSSAIMRRPDQGEGDDRSLYADDTDEESNKEPHDEV